MFKFSMLKGLRMWEAKKSEKNRKNEKVDFGEFFEIDVGCRGSLGGKIFLWGELV